MTEQNICSKCGKPILGEGVIPTGRLEDYCQCSKGEQTPVGENTGIKMS